LARCPGGDVITEQPKNSKTYPFSNDTHRKPRTQISKVFFQCKLQDFMSLSMGLNQSSLKTYNKFGWNSSLACSGGELSLFKMPPVEDSMHFLQFSDFGVKWGLGP